MKAIVGLGNPGPQYDRTRHNMGFMVVDELAKRQKLTFRSGKGNYLQAVLTQNDYGLFKPMTWMNNSGQAVQTLMNWFKIEDEDVLVISDDLDLDFPSLRLRGNGSSGGHKGLDSIIRHLGSNQFARLKLGISNENRTMQATESFVLSRFSKEEREELPGVIQEAADAVESYLKKGLIESMNAYNRKSKQQIDTDQLEANI